MMTNEQRLASFTKDSYQQTVTKVNERVYHFLGWGHSNAIAILAKQSIILIDTLDSDARAHRLKAYLATISDKPVKTIIYTHGHPDHLGGAGAFQDTVEEIIAFAAHKPILKHYERLQKMLDKRSRFQHGYGQNDNEAISQGIGIREGKEVGDGQYAMLPATTIYQQEVVERVIDGIPMKLFSAVGESDDQLGVWLPEDQVLCTGDTYYGCWPNLYAIRGTQYRDIATWIDTLDHMLSYPAIALLPGHTKALLGHDQIQEVVGGFRNAIESILLQTLDCMNLGMNVSETVAQVKLPPEYQDAPYLKEFYGTIEWSVRGIYQGYVGWFDGDAANLLPLSDETFANQLYLLIDDAKKLMDKIKECLEREEAQLALQLIRLMEYTVQNDELTQLKKQALYCRAKQMTSSNARHYYIASAKELV